MSAQGCVCPGVGLPGVGLPGGVYLGGCLPPPSVKTGVKNYLSVTTVADGNNSSTK